MVGEWREAQLNELVEVYDGPHATPKKTDSGPIFLGISNLAHGRIDLSDTEHLSEEDFQRWTRRVTPQPGDIVFSYETRLGEAAMIPHGLRCCLGRRMGLLRARPGRVDPRFLLYAYLGDEFQETLRARTIHGSTVDRIPLIDMPKFPIRVTLSVNEQRAIAHILGTLDDKIELNRRMSETLEAMARALFKAWFVDFEPVRAKHALSKVEGMAGRWQRGQSLPGLPAYLYDLFPDRLVDSELGEIPEGWEVTKLGEMINAVKGTSYRSDELAESDTALITLKSFARGGGYRAEGLKSFSGAYKPAQVVVPGEVVIACTDVAQAAEVIGRPAVARATHEFRTLVASLDTLIVRPREPEMTRSFLYFLTGTDEFVAHTYAHTTGTTVLHLSKDAVPSFRFACPPPGLVKSFDSLASSVLHRLQTIQQESDALANLRDTLLPKLISGELRVPDAERWLEATQ